jgi:hypothetical protein
MGKFCGGKPDRRLSFIMIGQKSFQKNVAYLACFIEGVVVRTIGSVSQRYNLNLKSKTQSTPGVEGLHLSMGMCPGLAEAARRGEARRGAARRKARGAPRHLGTATLPYCILMADAEQKARASHDSLTHKRQ